MRGLAVIGARLVASGALVAAAAAFLVFFGPRPMPAYADIYAPLARAGGWLPPPPGGPALRAGTALVNGQPFRYVVGHSRLRVDEVLSHYERQFVTTTPESTTPISTAARVRGGSAGAVAGMVTSRMLHPDEFTRRLRAFAETSRLAALGEFHLISAFEQEGTVFIDFTPGATVRLDRLLPAGDEDAPGEDLDGVGRPAGLQRLLTVEHGEGRDWSRTLVYRASDGRAAVAGFRTALAAAGWTENPMVEVPGILHFSDGRRECFVGGSGEADASAVVLVYRLL